MHPCRREHECSDPDTDAQGHSVPRQTHTAFCVVDTGLVSQALAEIPTLYYELNCLLPRGGSASNSSPVSGTQERQLPLRLDILTLQEDVEATLRDHAARLRGFVSPPRRMAVAVHQDSSYLRVRLSALLSLDEGRTGTEAGLYYLLWQHHARRIQGQHRQAERMPLPCPQCDVKSLIREYGSETTECRSCGKRISWTQYGHWSLYCDSVAVVGKKRK